MTQDQTMLKLALRVFGVVFMLVYPLSLVWPSGWVWHGGEGQKARDAVAAMTAKERKQLIAFLNSL